MESVKLPSQGKRAAPRELGSIIDRLANVKRIVTDQAHGLTREIELLRSNPAN